MRRSGRPGAAGTLLEPVSWAIGARALSLPAAFVFHVAVSRILGADGAGSFQFCLALSLIAATVARLGVGTRLLRDTARAIDAAEVGKVAPMYAGAAMVVVVTSVFVAASMLWAQPWLASRFQGSAGFGATYATMTASVVPLALVILNCRFLAGSGAAAGSVFFENAAVPLVALALLPALVGAADPGAAAHAYAAAVLAAATATTALAIVRIRRLSVGAPRPLRARLASLRSAASLGMTRARGSLYFYGSELLNIVLGTVDWVLLGILAGSAEVGVFNAVLRLAVGATFLRLPVYTRISPLLAASAGRGDTAELERLARGAARTVFVGTAPLLVILVVAPGACLSLFGAEFHVGAAALALVALGKMVEVAAGPARELLMMSGNESRVTVVAAVTLAVQIAVAVVLVPVFGLVGAAATNVIATVLQFAAASWFVHRELGIVPWCIGLPSTGRRSAAQAGLQW